MMDLIRKGPSVMSQAGDHKDLMLLVDELKKRGVVSAKARFFEDGRILELEVHMTPDFGDTNQLTDEQKRLLLENPETPEAMKVRLREEYDKDLYGSA